MSCHGGVGMNCAETNDLNDRPEETAEEVECTHWICGSCTTQSIVCVLVLWSLAAFVTCHDIIRFRRIVFISYLGICTHSIIHISHLRSVVLSATVVVSTTSTTTTPAITRTHAIAASQTTSRHANSFPIFMRVNVRAVLTVHMHRAHKILFSLFFFPF